MAWKEKQFAIKSLTLWFLLASVSMTLANVAFVLYSLSQSRSTLQNSSPAVSKPTAVRVAVTGMGHLEPQGEMIRLSAPTSVEGTRVARITVKEADRVRMGQVIAILDTYEPRLAALAQAKQQAKVVQARLVKVKAGAQLGEIKAQKAAIARLEAERQGQQQTLQATLARLAAERRNAQVDFQRYEKLYRDGAVSAQELDGRQLSAETTTKQLSEAESSRQETIATLQRQIEEATANLSKIQEVRPVDVQVAQAEVEEAIAAVQKAKADLTLSYVRAPKDSQILKIHARPGEIIREEGIADLGQTKQMYAVAEIYETDISKVHLGQRATITSAAFPERLQGVVTQIGLQVSQQEVVSDNPAADTDRKVVEVKVRTIDPEANKLIAGLTNLQVQVAIYVKQK